MEFASLFLPPTRYGRHYLQDSWERERLNVNLPPGCENGGGEMSAAF